jgi:hypothetical protein
MRLFRASIIFVLVLLADVNFTPQTAHLLNPQQVTRLALTLSLLAGHVDIDAFAAHTVDIASYGGHAYADKPPGLSMLALPAVAAVKAISGSADPLQPQAIAGFLSAAILSTNGVLGALGAAVLYALVLSLGASERSSVFAAAALALGTPFFGWSTVFFAHSASGGLLLIAFAIAAWPGESRWRGAILGLLLGVLLTVDLTAAPAIAIVAGYFLFASHPDRLRPVLMLGIGGLVGVLPLLVYGQVAFGSPFHLGYSDVVGFTGMKQGLFGLTTPNPGVLFEILFGLYRGLLPLSPVLILVPIGLVTLWREKRAVALVVIGAIVCSLAINSSYAYWDGGSATGPRHLVSMLPMACVALAFVRPRGAWTIVVALLALASFVISVVCASTEMLSGVERAAPFFDDILPRFLAGGPMGAAPVLISWFGIAALWLWTPRSGAKGDELAARPLEATGQVELEQE